MSFAFEIDMILDLTLRSRTVGAFLFISVSLLHSTPAQAWGGQLGRRLALALTPTPKSRPSHVPKTSYPAVRNFALQSGPTLTNATLDAGARTVDIAVTNKAYSHVKLELPPPPQGHFKNNITTFSVDLVDNSGKRLPRDIMPHDAEFSTRRVFQSLNKETVPSTPDQPAFEYRTILRGDVTTGETLGILPRQGNEPALVSTQELDITLEGTIEKQFGLLSKRRNEISEFKNGFMVYLSKDGRSFQIRESYFVPREGRARPELKFTDLQFDFPSLDGNRSIQRFALISARKINDPSLPQDYVLEFELILSDGQKVKAIFDVPKIQGEPTQVARVTPRRWEASPFSGEGAVARSALEATPVYPKGPELWGAGLEPVVN